MCIECARKLVFAAMRDMQDEFPPAMRASYAAGIVTGLTFGRVITSDEAITVESETLAALKLDEQVTR